MVAEVFSLIAEVVHGQPKSHQKRLMKSLRLEAWKISVNHYKVKAWFNLRTIFKFITSNNEL